MIDRRAFLALGLSLPVGKSSLLLDIPDPNISALNTEGVVLIGISPDSSVLLGLRDRERISFLDAKTRDVISETEPTEWMRLIDEMSINWSPDGTRIAFSLRPWSVSVDSDIFVADIASGELINITPEESGLVADSLMTANTAQHVDTSPTWLDDDTLVFARHSFPDGGDIQCELCRVSISTGETETFLDLEPHNIRSLGNSIWRLSNGDLVFMGDSYDLHTGREAVKVSADGELTKIDAGAERAFFIESVNDTHMIALDVQRYAWWYAQLDGGEEPELLWDHFTMPDGWRQVSPAILGPEPDTMFVVLRTEHDRVSAQLFGKGQTLQLAELQGDFASHTSHWSEDLVLVAGESDSWLVPLKEIQG